MKYLNQLSALVTLMCFCMCLNSYGQGVAQPLRIADQMTWTSHTTASADAPIRPNVAQEGALHAMPAAAARNFKTFSPVKKNTSADAMAANRGYESHPELGVLFPGAPCSDCYEVIGARTETNKTYERHTADGGKDVMVATSTMPMHYKDARGNWRTIKTQLEPAMGTGVYAATEQPVPVTINTQFGYTALGGGDEQILFNANLELVYVKSDGTEVSLGRANWTNHTAGDQGAYVTNAWPGVDIEMSTMRGAIKTNFYLNHAMPAYADGKLLVRDHMNFSGGLSLNSGGQTRLTDFLTIRDRKGEVKYSISVANVYEKNNPRTTAAFLEYNIGAHNTVDIVLPGALLNKPAASYPMVIDPLVSSAPGTSTVINGCTYNATWTAGVGCSYTNIATTPANCTLTDIQFGFEYTSATAGAEYCGYSFYKGTCRSPGTAAAGFSWSCASILPGTCTAVLGAAYSIWGTPGAGTSGLGPCVPAPQCAPYNLNIQMLFYQNWLTTPPCSITYYYGSQPLVIIVFGHTVELTAAGVTGSPLTVCAGQAATLSATGTYGVPPYVYSWSPGPVAGSPAVVNPTSTTNYVLTVTDACGITTGGNVTITVNPTTPINGTLTVCAGNTTTLTNATAGGTWTSGATTVATVVAGTGVVTGLIAGTAPITYTTAAGCKAFATVTVTPLPAAISGTPVVCAGSTTTLSDATSTGPWSSSNVGVATVSASGVVTGVAAGTATITCGATGCAATIIVTVNATPHIAGTAFTNPTTCNATDGTITLTGLNAGESYTVHYTSPTGAVTATIVADGTGNVVITGLGGGNFTGITVTNSFGCTSNAVGPIVLVAAGNPPSPIVTNNSPVCAGGTVTFNLIGVTGVTYQWSGPGGFTSTEQNPTISPAGLGANGTYFATVTLAGCTSLPGATVVTVNPVPVITIKSTTNPSLCLGADGTITLAITGMPGVTVYNVTYDFNGVTSSHSFTSNVSNDLTITGLSQGTYSNIYITTPAGCISGLVGPVQLSDPSAPPTPTINANTPLCIGQTLLLQGNDLAPGGTYAWTFAAGGTSTLQNPSIANTTIGDAGIYVLSYNVANCISSTTANIMLYPPINLTNITPNTAIPRGSSIQLDVQGARYYAWTPNDGSLNNPNINNPVARPLDSTVYTVVGTSEWGCMDSLHVTITLIDVSPVVVPTAFTPNGDGLNDVFRLGNLSTQKLVEFSVFNRWGQLIYHNATDPKAGWDGSYNGVIQDLGVYNYIIILANAEGTNTILKGDVTLIK